MEAIERRVWQAERGLDNASDGLFGQINHGRHQRWQGGCSSKIKGEHATELVQFLFSGVLAQNNILEAPLPWPLISGPDNVLPGCWGQDGQK